MADKEFEIWQLKEGAPDTPQMLFTNYDYMAKHNFPINMSTYDCVYAGMTAAETTPEDIYVRFNINHPEDYRAHSLSVSDVVVFKEDGMARAYFMDSIGYKELPEFFDKHKIEYAGVVCKASHTFHNTIINKNILSELSTKFER